MKLLRRKFLHLAAGAAALPAVSRLARAQTFPTRPVRIVVGFAAGGAPDILARLLGQWLSERLGQPFVVENRTGAGGNIATEAVVQAAADGHTLLLTSVGNAVNVTLYDKLNYNFLRDIAPVAGISREPLAMEVHPSFPAKTVSEFIAYAKANPGKINFGSAGSGTPQQTIAEMFKMMAGVDMVHVPYHGSAPELTDLIAGHIQVVFEPIQATVGHIKSGTLRPLAVTTATRSDLLPDVPTVAETIAGFEARTWQGIGAPKAVPAEIINLINGEVIAALREPALKAKLADLGISPMPMTPAECQAFITAEVEKWAKVIKFASIKPE